MPSKQLRCLVQRSLLLNATNINSGLDNKICLRLKAPPKRSKCRSNSRPAWLPLQANEQRYRLLESKHTALLAEKDKLFNENEELRSELTAARLELSKAQTALMAKDAELERRNVEVSSLQSDKASLDKLLQVCRE